MSVFKYQAMQISVAMQKKKKMPMRYDFVLHKGCDQ